MMRNYLGVVTRYTLVFVGIESELVGQTKSVGKSTLEIRSHPVTRFTSRSLLGNLNRRVTGFFETVIPLRP